MDIKLTDTTYVALPNFDSVGNSIISVLGSLVMVILVVRIVVAYGKKQWGEMITEVVAVIFVGWFVWFPDSAKATIKEIAKSIFGG
jgi:nicotinamide riboside transporter PnuC